MSVWNATGYQSQFGFIWQYGEGLIAQLEPQPGERILDLGCGTGQLTKQIAMSGAQVLGMDSDDAMVQQAQANYPDLSFQVGDAASFSLEMPVDAVFSNAALHWVQDAPAAARCIAKVLKPGGRFVAEFGGQGNVKTILTALSQVCEDADLNPWYFPSLAEYVGILDSVGLDVIFAHIFDRPTPLGSAGLAGWLDMFGRRFFAEVPAAQWAERVKAVEAAAAQLYQVEENSGVMTDSTADGQWVADYRRLRVMAIKR